MGKINDTKKTVMLSLLSATVAVLTVLGNFVRFGPFPITLALCPIIVGAAIYGPSAGAILGGVFGLAVFVTGLFGWDGGAVMMLMSANPLALVLVCFGKAIAAGWCAGLVYKAFSEKQLKVGVVAAGIVCPVVNTGIFVVAMLLFFRSTLQSWAGGKDIVTYILFGMTGINFLVELGVNMILAAGITTIIKYAKNNM